MSTPAKMDSRFVLVHSDFKDMDSECIVAKANSADAMNRIVSTLCSGDWLYKFRENIIFRDKKTKKQIILNDFDKNQDIKMALSKYLKAIFE